RREACPLNLHQERKDVAPLAAAETVEHLARRTDDEGRSLLRVEGAKAFKVLPCLTEREVGTDDFDDIGPVSNPIDDIFRDQPSIHPAPDPSEPLSEPFRLTEGSPTCQR